MPIARYANWEVRQNAVASTVNNPLAWSTGDSLAWAFRCIDALASWPELGITSTLYPSLAGQYADLAGFQSYVAGRGWATAADAATEVLGPASSLPLTRLQRGDIVYVAEMAPPEDECLDCALQISGTSLDPTHGTGFGRLFVMTDGVLLTPGPDMNGEHPNRIELRLDCYRCAATQAWHIPFHAMTGDEEARLRRAERFV
ncbi:MAG: hypothetical protein ABI629_07905 [bacterium]